jgi:hypothetical protein
MKTRLPFFFYSFLFLCSISVNHLSAKNDSNTKVSNNESSIVLTRKKAMPIQDLTLSYLGTATICAGATTTFSYNIQATFGATNEFFIQMSNIGGAFVTPVNIFNLIPTGASGTVQVQIPFGTPTGNNYRFRLIATQPSTTSVQTDAISISGTVGDIPSSSSFVFIGEISGKIYFRSTVAQNWSTARTTCINNGGQLATVQSQQENDLIFRNTGTAGVFIGLNDFQTEGVFVFESQSRLGFTNWATGEPNNSSNEDIVELRSDNGRWNDVQQNLSRFFILELNPAGVNQRICQGTTVTLNASNLAGATYAWTGPNGFSSSLQNPTISNAGATNAGVYTLSVTKNNCTSSLFNTRVEIAPLPINIGQQQGLNSSLSSNLVVHLPMNGTAQDLSGNNSNGTIAGGVTPDVDRFGSVQSALRFNGSNGHITLPPGVYFNGSDFTVNVWVQKFSNNNWSRVFDFGNSNANQNILVGLSSTTTGRPAAQNYQGTSAFFELVSVDVLPNNQWQMLTYTWSQNAGQLFIDGKLVAHGRQNTPSNVVRNLNYIGRSNWSGDGFANATFDEFRIYNKLLTFEDITILLTQQPNLLTLTYNQTPICVGSSIVLTLNNTQRGMSYQLQNAATNANIGVAQIGNGQSLTYTLSDLTSTTNVRFSITNPSFSCNAVLSPTSEIILNSVVAAPLATGTSVCSSGSITLTASGAGSNDSYNWYTTPTGGQPIINENDATFTTPIITISTSYYVSIVNNQGCESERTMITAIINNPLGPNVDLVNGLVLHYKFDGTTTDSSGNGINATFVGSNSGFSVDRNGNENSAAFIGPSAYLDAGNPAVINQLTNRVTVSMWVRQTQSWFGDQTPLLNKWGGTGMYIALDGFNVSNPQNRVRWRINNNTFVTSSVNVPNSTWTHIVCVYTGAQLRIYQNGVLTGQTNQTGNIPVTGSNLQIGRQANGLGAIDYRGDLDEVKIYDRALNVEEIRTLFNNESVAFANTPFCDGQGDLALTTFNFPGATYQWTGPNGFSSTQQNPTVIPNATTQNSAGLYTLVVTDSNGCTSAPQTVEAEINAFPVITEVANGTVCGSGSAVLSVVNPLPETTYRWYVNEVGGTPIAGQTQATLTLTNVTQTTIRYVSAVKNNCEGARIAVSAIYFNNADISLAVTGSTVCSGAEFASVTIAATENIANYRLFYNGVVVSAVFIGGGTLTIPFNTSVLSNGLNTVTVQVNFPNCGVVDLTNQAEVSINVPVAVTVSASGSLQLCPTDSVTLTAPQGTQYLWSNGATTQSVTVSSAQTLTVAVTFENGCSSESQPVVVTLNQIPIPVIEAQGETQFCAGGNVVLNASGGQTYLWSTGSTSNAITVTQSGQYNFVAFNGNCEAASQTITVTVGELPLTPQNINGPISSCGNETILFSIPEVSNADGYLWVLPNGWSGVSITNSIQVLVGTAGGTISVVAQNECGNSVASTLTISIIEINTAVNQNQNELLALAENAQFQWVNCETNTEIQGETNASFTPIQDGNYAVLVTQNGCSELSDCFQVQLLSIEDNQLFNHIVAFPNPVTDIVTIRLNSASSEPFKIKITTILGQELYEKNVVVDETNQLYLDFTNYPTGSYFVNLILNSEVRTIKIIKN